MRQHLDGVTKPGRSGFVGKAALLFLTLPLGVARAQVACNPSEVTATLNLDSSGIFITGMTVDHTAIQCDSVPALLEVTLSDNATFPLDCIALTYGAQPLVFDGTLVAGFDTFVCGVSSATHHLQFNGPGHYTFEVSSGGLGGGLVQFFVVTVTASQQKFKLQATTIPPGLAPNQSRDLPPGGGTVSPALRFGIGQEFEVSVVQVNPDGTLGTQVPSQITFLDQMTNPAPVASDLFPHPTVLFPNTVLIRFTQSPNFFFPIHSGAASLSVSFQPPGASSPTKVTMQVIVTPTGLVLGSRPNTFDDLILGFADLRGIPPYILKSQIGHETAGRFEPNSYRYEPLSVDFLSVSMGLDLRVDPRFAPWRLGTFPDTTNPVPSGLAQGTQLTPGVVQPRDLYFVELDPQTLIPVRDDLAFNPLEPFRKLMPTDQLVSMENILETNDDCDFPPRQRWSLVGSGPGLLQQFYAYRSSGGTAFTGQTVIGASYALLQVLYTTAVDQMKYKDSRGVGRSPAGLFDPKTSVDLGTEYLARKFAKAFGPAPAISGVHDLESVKFETALMRYNGDSDPGFYAEPILLKSSIYFPLGP